MVEIWPRLIDWEGFTRNYRHGDIGKGVHPDWSLPPESADPSDSGIANGAMIDAFKLVEPHLPPDVREAVGMLVISIATLQVEGWNQKDYLESASTEAYVYSPETVRNVLAKFDSVDRSRLASEITAAWAAMDAKPEDWYYTEEDIWEDPQNFIDYLLGWRAAFVEAAEKGAGLMIDGG